MSNDIEHRAFWEKKLSSNWVMRNYSGHKPTSMLDHINVMYNLVMEQIRKEDEKSSSTTQQYQSDIR